MVAIRIMEYMNKPESNGAVPSEEDARHEMVNLLDRARIQRIEASVLVDRMAPSGSGSSNK